MLLHFDNNHILTVENPTIPTLKPYQHKASGYTFTSFDKGILAYSKKKRNLINLKNFGDGMQLAYLHTRPPFTKLTRVTSQCSNALALFSGFDEERWHSYHFLPYYHKDISWIQKFLDQYCPDSSIYKTTTSTIITGLAHTFAQPEWLDAQLSFLFMLTLLYGKLDQKNGMLTAIKIHLPLFGQRLSYQESFEKLLSSLQQQGIFITRVVNSSPQKTILELSSTDIEILACFSDWYTSLFGQILSSSSLQEKHHTLKQQLLEYLSTKPQLQIDWLEKVIQQLASGTLKFLKK